MNQFHVWRRPPHLPQQLAPHADRQLAAQPRRQRLQGESHVDIGNVVATDQERSVETAQVLAPDNRRMRHDQRRRPGQQVVDELANPGDRPALCPARIAISALRRLLRLVQQALEIADGADIARSSLPSDRPGSDLPARSSTRRDPSNSGSDRLRAWRRR